VALQIWGRRGQGPRMASLEGAGSVSVAGECSGRLFYYVRSSCFSLVAARAAMWSHREAGTSSSAWTRTPCSPAPAFRPGPSSSVRTELYSYENKYERTGGAQITLPIIGGGFSVGGSGSYCHAVVRVIDGKVVAG
jgi:hypothetical protein